MKTIIAAAIVAVGMFVNTMFFSSALAAEHKVGTQSCELTFLDVYCAKNPEECKNKRALRNTSVHSDFNFYTSPPHHNSVSVTNINRDNLDADKLFRLVNEYRTSIGLSEFRRDANLCEIAESRGPELNGEIQSGNIHRGMRARNLPYWVTENMKYGSSEEEVLQWWLSSPIHRKAIQGDSTYACTHCAGRVCIMLFTSYVPR